ncbi:MAG: glycosyltransferase family 39 protein [Patescibacteria group bacterium]
MNKIFNLRFLFPLIIILFLGIHIAGLSIPYHQDEYKWVYYSQSELGVVPHPPLTEFIYKQFGPVVGDNNFRLIPAVFGLANLFLIFYLAKTIFNSRTALWTAFLFTISFYSLLASLMVDVDGAVMPFFLLIMMISYYKLRARSFELRGGNIKWLVCLILGAIGGFLTKMSGVLPLMALLLDFALLKGLFQDKKRIFKFFGLGLGLGVGVVLILLLAKIVFPFFPIEKSLVYWKHFANSSSFLDRGWLQTFIQFAKTVMYTSPLLILPVFLVDREIFQKTRVFFFFIFIGIFFYLFAFDFSIGALDRYFQFLVIPLCVIIGAIFSQNFSSNNSPTLASLGPSLTLREGTALGVIAVLVFFLQFFNHFVPPLYPKTEWLERVLSFKWNFLFPFTGGSGPTGFYISFAFMALIWIISLVFARKRMILAILILGLLYNVVFIEEYLFGEINGSARSLFKEAKEVIIKDPKIKEVLVYNDIGGFEIQQIGKYKRRIYATPQFQDTYKKVFADFDGHILFIDIPRIDSNSFYAEYFASCKNIYKDQNKYIKAEILDCKK